MASLSELPSEEKLELAECIYSPPRQGEDETYYLLKVFVLLISMSGERRWGVQEDRLLKDCLSRLELFFISVDRPDLVSGMFEYSTGHGGSPLIAVKQLMTQPPPWHITGIATIAIALLLYRSFS
jgi:hypothetical protein